MSSEEPKEDSPSLSIDNPDDESLPATTNGASGGDDLLSAPLSPSLKTSPSTIHRKQFLNAAPSLMKLITVAQTPTVVPNADFPDTMDLSTATARQSKPKSKHAQMPTVLGDVMEEFTKHNDMPDASDNAQLQSLALKAAEEFRLLSAKNDALFREKEQLRTKFDDRQERIQELEEQLSSIQDLQQDNERLHSMNGSLEVQLRMFEQEKVIMEDTMNELRSKNELLQAGSQFDDNAMCELPAEDINATINTAIGGGAVGGRNKEAEDRLMGEITRMTKERTAMEKALDEYKSEVAEKSKSVVELSGKVSGLEEEVTGLETNLAEVQNQYYVLEHSKQQAQHRYKRKMTIQTDQMVGDHDAKQRELEKTLVEYRSKISQLEDENKELLVYKYEGEKKRDSKGAKKLHLRLRTKNDVFGGEQLYDMDPFGANGAADEEQFMSDGTRSTDGDDPEPTFHGRQDTRDGLENESLEDPDQYIIPATHSQTDSTQLIEAAPVDSGSCSCFSSVFGKLTRTNGRDKTLSNAKPLAVQEIRGDD